MHWRLPNTIKKLPLRGYYLNTSKKSENSKLQLLLLQESWKDLFILHLSQWAIPWDLSNLLMSRQNQLRKAGNVMPNEEEIIDMEMKSMQVRGLIIKNQ